MGATTPDGVLLVDKPEGVTSHDVVAAARRAIGVRRIGHLGTLDPFATGLLVLLVGRATRLAPFVDAEPKVYEATIAFGAETATDDRTGTTVRTAPVPQPGAVDAGMQQLTGVIDQLPPAYSAKKHEGMRAYEIARRGGSVELAATRVTIHRWDIKGRTEATLAVRIECSGGTYIRALARDLGRLAGSAAHLARLRRLRSGCFSVAEAVQVGDLGSGTAQVLSPLTAIPSMATCAVGTVEWGQVLHGQAIAARESIPAEGGLVAITDDADTLLAVAERRGAQLHPKVVLRDA